MSLVAGRRPDCGQGGRKHATAQVGDRDGTRRARPALAHGWPGGGSSGPTIWMGRSLGAGGLRRGFPVVPKSPDTDASTDGSVFASAPGPSMHRPRQIHQLPGPVVCGKRCRPCDGAPGIVRVRRVHGAGRSTIPAACLAGFTQGPTKAQLPSCGGWAHSSESPVAGAFDLMTSGAHGRQRTSIRVGCQRIIVEHGSRACGTPSSRRSDESGHVVPRPRKSRRAGGAVTAPTSDGAKPPGSARLGRAQGSAPGR